jgi:hypothetical protein
MCMLFSVKVMRLAVLLHSETMNVLYSLYYSLFCFTQYVEYFEYGTRLKCTTGAELFV